LFGPIWIGPLVVVVIGGPVVGVIVLAEVDVEVEEARAGFTVAVPVERRVRAEAQQNECRDSRQRRPEPPRQPSCHPAELRHGAHDCTSFEVDPRHPIPARVNAFFDLRLRFHD
jgi:hypothetical protein